MATKTIIKEIITTSKEALLLHESLSHPQDAQLCQDLALGKHPYSTLTCTDIMMMRDFLGSCVHCMAGRSNPKQATRPLSTLHQPPGVISFDPQKIPCPVLGDFTHKVTIVHKDSGLILQPGTKSKTAPAIFEESN